MSATDSGEVCIFGATGQIGSYLVEKELEGGASVCAMVRRTSTGSLCNLADALKGPYSSRLRIITCDVTDPWAVLKTLREIKPWAVYNLAAMSFVKTSFDEPQHTTAATYLGAVNILEAARELGFCVYQASSSEMYGSAVSYICTAFGRIDDVAPTLCGFSLLQADAFQDEATPFVPNSPYAVAKLAAHNMVRIYRASYGCHASAGIVFNTESPRRGREFVTRKVTDYVAGLLAGKKMQKLSLGNLSAYRDWTHARDTAKAIYRIIRRVTPDDYCIGSGQTRSIQDLLETAFGYAQADWREHVVCDSPQHLRPCEVQYLRARPEKARKAFNWTAQISFQDLIHEMIECELKAGDNCGK